MFRWLQAFVRRELVSDVPPEMSLCLDCGKLECTEVNSETVRDAKSVRRNLPPGHQRRRLPKKGHTNKALTCARPTCQGGQ